MPEASSKDTLEAQYNQIMADVLSQVPGNCARICFSNTKSRGATGHAQVMNPLIMYALGKTLRVISEGRVTPTRLLQMDGKDSYICFPIDMPFWKHTRIPNCSRVASSSTCRVVLSRWNRQLLQRLEGLLRQSGLQPLPRPSSHAPLGLLRQSRLQLPMPLPRPTIQAPLGLLRQSRLQLPMPLPRPSSQAPLRLLLQSRLQLPIPLPRPSSQAPLGLLLQSRLQLPIPLPMPSSQAPLPIPTWRQES